MSRYAERDAAREAARQTQDGPASRGGVIITDHSVVRGQTTVTTSVNTIIVGGDYIAGDHADVVYGDQTNRRRKN